MFFSIPCVFFLGVDFLPLISNSPDARQYGRLVLPEVKAIGVLLALSCVASALIWGVSNNLGSLPRGSYI